MTSRVTIVVDSRYGTTLALAKAVGRALGGRVARLARRVEPEPASVEMAANTK